MITKRSKEALEETQRKKLEKANKVKSKSNQKEIENEDSESEPEFWVRISNEHYLLSLSDTHQKNAQSLSIHHTFTF